MRDRISGGSGRCAFALAVLAPRDAAGRGREVEIDLESRVVEQTLPNGMRVIVLPRRQSPTVALSMQFLVGSAQEAEGASGLAHLLEHMMFKGTRSLGTRDWDAERPLLEEIEGIVGELDAERRRGEAADDARVAALEERLAAAQDAARALVVKDEIDAIYTANGAQDFNASTGVDVTTYKVSLPANRLPLWARIESERLREPVHAGVLLGARGRPRGAAPVLRGRPLAQALGAVPRRGVPRAPLPAPDHRLGR